jgi:aryl-alcohol dehydrogenase-like predicted oxidoreductase
MAGTFPDMPAEAPARASGTFAIGGELTVHRLGFGAMRLPAAWDERESGGASREMLREAVRLGVDFIDTAHAYGRSEEVLAEALHPYPDGLVIATKGGLRRGGDPDGRPERLREDCEKSLRRLRLEAIDLWQLHRVDPAVPVEEQFGAIRELRDEGKIRFVGVSEVTAAELARARALVEIATVQNRYNIAQRGADDVLAVCEADGVGFMPWAPIRAGGQTVSSDALAAVAERHHATPPQVALAWLLQRSPVMLPIPGTSTREHMRENIDSALIGLSEEDVATLERPA